MRNVVLLQHKVDPRSCTLPHITRQILSIGINLFKMSDILNLNIYKLNQIPNPSPSLCYAMPCKYVASYHISPAMLRHASPSQNLYAHEISHLLCLSRHINLTYMSSLLLNFPTQSISLSLSFHCHRYISLSKLVHSHTFPTFYKLFLSFHFESLSHITQNLVTTEF